MEDGTWMLWENSSAAAVAAVAVARSFLDKFSKKIVTVSLFYEKLTFGDILFKKVVFQF